jgi:RNA polymerase sigma-70 factor (ECF subfamily)
MRIFPFPSKKSADCDFESLVRPHLDHMYRLAYRFCGNRDNAEDLVQDVLTKLYAKQAQLANIDHLQTWLAKVIYRQFIDNTRRQSRSPLQSIEDTTDVSDPVAHLGSQPEQQAEQAQAFHQLQTAFSQLSEEHRILISLHDMEGYPLKEIQEILSIPLGTLKSRLHRARAQLREIIGKSMN